MNYVRRFIFAVIILLVLYSAWYGAEILIHGQSQRSVIDLFIAVMISLSISGKIEKGVEKGERERKFAEEFATRLTEQIKKGEETKDGKNGSGKEIG